MKKSDLNSVISLMERNDNFCQGAAQQVSNGFYRCYDMLWLIIQELDENGVHTSALNSINRTYNHNETMSQSAPQQSVNGSYRCVELLEVLIRHFDPNGSKRSAVNAVNRDLERNDNLCQSSPQQMVNGAYRIVDMLEILTGLIAPELNGGVSRAIREMNRMDGLTNGAPQQTANGTSTIAEIACLLARHFDKSGSYRYRINSIVTHMERNNNLCQGADQQSGNYLYRTVEFMGIIGECILDQVQERTRAYWEAHSEEKQALENEKRELRAKISEIEREARTVNDGGEIAPLKRQISAKEDESRRCGQNALKEIQNRIDKLKAEKSAAGFFDFKKKKAIQEQIDATENELFAKKQEIKKLQAEIQKEIDALNSQIQAIEKRVESAKAAILAKRKPFQRRIEAIDHELTRRR